jgi:predicted nuclease with TOPRIM domain
MVENDKKHIPINDIPLWHDEDRDHVVLHTVGWQTVRDRILALESEYARQQQACKELVEEIDYLRAVWNTLLDGQECEANGNKWVRAERVEELKAEVELWRGKAWKHDGMVSELDQRVDELEADNARLRADLDACKKRITQLIKNEYNLYQSRIALG